MIKSTRNFYINIANEIKENLEKYNRKIFYNNICLKIFHQSIAHYIIYYLVVSSYFL